MPFATEALERLRDGNRRFVAGDHRAAIDVDHRRDLARGQQPFAVVIGCSDSRVPVEMVFDQGLGDLFVIRVAGNIVAQSQVDSVEFAVEALGAPLVVVLGHSDCGAVRATLDALDAGGGEGRPALPGIVERIRPAVEALHRDRAGADPSQLVARAVRANILASVAALQTASPILAQRLGSGALAVVGAEYELASGRVDFLEG